ncbi:GTPase Era-like [Bolinopsis microptera]|uniref:GTPase Era-like n=1 Tax=Bolinopsis microptera TaxID=2820187 RepID=UPI0030793776
MRSISRLARLQSRSSYLTVPSPVENRICYQENRLCSLQNTTVSRPPYRSFVSGFSGSTSIPEDEQKSVRVAIIGSPNVGKSTLLNSLMQQYISPVSKLRNTTMGEVLGVITQDDTQVVFVDTPGLLPGEFKTRHQKPLMKEYYHKSLTTIQDSLLEADVALFMFDCSLSLYRLFITADLEDVIESIPDIPKILVLNKIDKAREGEKIDCIVEQLTTPRPPFLVPEIAMRSDINPSLLGLQYEDDFRDGREFDEIVTLSALQGTHVNYIWYTIRQLAVHRPWQYGPDVVSPDDIESVVTTIVRAEILKKAGYHLAYDLDHKFIGYKEEADKLTIEFAIFRKQPVFKTQENKEESIKYIQELLSTRFGCPVDFRLIDRRVSQQKSQLLDIIDMSQEPDIEVFEE